MSRACFTSRSLGNTKIHTIMWTVERNILNEEQTQMVHIYQLHENKAEVDAKNGKRKKRFEMKMKLTTDDEYYPEHVLKVYFRTSKTIFCIEYQLIFDPDQPKCRPVVIEKNMSMQANNWMQIFTVTEDMRSMLTSPDGNLRLKFEFLVINDYVMSMYNLSDDDEYYVPEIDFSGANRLVDFLRDSLFADVTINSVEKRPLRAHKVILAHRSPVLRSCFEHRTSESETNIVESCFEYEVLKDLLTFMYCNRAPRIYELVNKLLEAADYYQITQLKAYCEKLLIKNLSVENAIETLRLADLYSASNLEEMVLGFIKEGNVPNVMETKAWGELEDVPLVKRILETCYCD